ncbi:hypothetical protein [Kitasatospora cheerisanensis]|uniref:Uncharacterized protein n=1 Tax=Kitasatospora cheerisanensis KCTC 2395 TaxID=1348663 RepID=A0A066YSZ6_9ACTN|nr:hypothetical protein [Kitasatospora cheerisanensis]KDN84367.1 hypothetical protein KCH_41580 [Kitasatospora cheerisanensis KCTC 2395]
MSTPTTPTEPDPTTPPPPAATAGQNNGGTGSVDNGPYPSMAPPPSNGATEDPYAQH